MEMTSLSIFPIIRSLSTPIARILVRLSVTPNQITFMSLIFGLLGAACFIYEQYLFHIFGAVLLIICYALDNCDGEVARLKNMSTRFGEYFDTFVDWLVHAAFFMALGYGIAVFFNNDLWFFLGVAAAVGGTINYILGFFIREPSNPETIPPQQPPARSVKDYFVLFFRELSRADFCFIVLLAAVCNVLWLLLLFAAVGAQVYWMTNFIQGARKFHV